MRYRRVIALVCISAAYAGTAGCADSSSPAARAWERATIQARGIQPTTTDPNSFMAASDGLGGVVFAPTDAGATEPRRSTFAHVPEE